MNYKLSLTFFISFFIIISINAQWKTSSGNNKFDGNFKQAYILGKGGSYPFNKPILHINRFNEGEPNLYLDNIGFTGCDNPSLSFAFDKSDEVFYFQAGSNVDNDAVFLSGTIREFSDLFKLFNEKSIVFVRHSNSCGQEDYEFSLSGSNKAIEYVISDFYTKKRIESEQNFEDSRKLDSVNKINKILKLKEKRKLDSLQSLKTKIKLDEKSLIFEKKLMQKFDFGNIGMSKSLLKPIMEFKISESTRAKYCKRIINFGLTYRDREILFYKSDSYRLWNRIDEGCMQMDILDSKGSLDKTIFISNTELQKLSDDYRLKVISKNWIALINTED